MHLDSTEPNNYNGFIHPAYISHVESFATTRAVKVLDTVIPHADSLDWARKGLLHHFSINGGGARLEAMVIRPNTELLLGVVDQLKPSRPALQWIADYYQASPETSISILMSAIEHPVVIQECSMLAGALLIEDMGFTDANNVAEFLSKNSHTSFNLIAANIALGLSLHYCSSPENILSFEQSVPEKNFIHIECASLWAKLGDEELCRHHLQMAAQKTKDRDLTMWRAISLKYLTLLGDFEQSERTREKLSIDTTFHGRTQMAVDLMVYVGTPEARHQAEVLMYQAEASIISEDQRAQLSRLWLDFFGETNRPRI